MKHCPFLLISLHHKHHMQWSSGNFPLMEQRKERKGMRLLEVSKSMSTYFKDDFCQNLNVREMKHLYSKKKNQGRNHCCKIFPVYFQYCSIYIPELYINKRWPQTNITEVIQMKVFLPRNVKLTRSVVCAQHMLLILVLVTLSNLFCSKQLADKS